VTCRWAKYGQSRKKLPKVDGTFGEVSETEATASAANAAEGNS
jgi:hypothetical protein